MGSDEGEKVKSVDGEGVGSDVNMDEVNGQLLVHWKLRADPIESDASSQLSELVPHSRRQSPVPQVISASEQD